MIEPHYPKPGNGRRPKELEQMLWIYFLQQWFNLADPAVEEALYDSARLRQFAGMDLGAEPVPDEAKGVRITTGTIVDATLIHAPSSTKNRDQRRDREMHQAKKGKNWCVSRTRVQIRGAVPKMGGGLPKPVYRSRLQTAQCCCVQKTWW